MVLLLLSRRPGTPKATLALVVVVTGILGPGKEIGTTTRGKETTVAGISMRTEIETGGTVNAIATGNATFLPEQCFILMRFPLAVGIAGSVTFTAVAEMFLFFSMVW